MAGCLGQLQELAADTSCPSTNPAEKEADPRAPRQFLEPGGSRVDPGARQGHQLEQRSRTHSWLDRDQLDQPLSRPGSAAAVPQLAGISWINPSVGRYQRLFTSGRDQLQQSSAGRDQLDQPLIWPVSAPFHQYFGGGCRLFDKNMNHGFNVLSPFSPPAVVLRLVLLTRTTETHYIRVR